MTLTRLTRGDGIVGTTTSTTVSAAGDGDTLSPVYYLGGPPILGYQPSVAQSSSGICAPPLSGTAWVTDVRLPPTSADHCGNLSWLIYPGVVGAWHYRQSINVPAGPPLGGAISVQADGVLMDITLNGHSLFHRPSPSSLYVPTSYSGAVDPAAVVTGAANLLEIVTIAPLRAGFTILNGTTALCFHLNLAVAVVKEWIRFTAPAGVMGRMVQHA